MTAVLRQDSALVTEVADISKTTLEMDLVILAAGFEDRAYEVLRNAKFRADAHCLIVRFINNIVGNRAFFEKYLADVKRHLPEENIHVVALRGANAEAFATDLNDALRHMPRNVRSVAIDISGMPSYVICTVLNLVRIHRSREPQLVLYTSASEYTPTKTEYDQLIAGGQDEIELLPRSMALEMAQNLVLDAFAGYRSQGAKSCLAVFAGYEAHRTSGIIDAINPALLLLLYGRPGDPELSWRLDLSRRLHKKFERGRRTAVEEVSTLEISESMKALETYYNFLIDDYDLVISPIGSKMTSVAAFLFWERYGEIQLTFPIPIGYNPANCPQGASLTYQLVLEPRRLLFKSDGAGGRN